MSYLQVNPDADSPGRTIGAIVQVAVLCVLTAGAGALALFAWPGTHPDDQPPMRDGESGERPLVLLLTRERPQLLVIVDSEELALSMKDWHEARSTPGDAFVDIEFVGPISKEALQEAIIFAGADCPQQGCRPLAVLDLREPADD